MRRFIVLIGLLFVVGTVYTIINGWPLPSPRAAAGVLYSAQGLAVTPAAAPTTPPNTPTPNYQATQNADNATAYANDSNRLANDRAAEDARHQAQLNHDAEQATARALDAQLETARQQEALKQAEIDKQFAVITQSISATVAVQQTAIPAVATVVYAKAKQAVSEADTAARLNATVLMVQTFVTVMVFLVPTLSIVWLGFKAWARKVAIDNDDKDREHSRKQDKYKAETERMKIAAVARVEPVAHTAPSEAEITATLEAARRANYKVFFQEGAKHGFSIHALCRRRQVMSEPDWAKTVGFYIERGVLIDAGGNRGTTWADDWSLERVEREWPLPFPPGTPAVCIPTSQHNAHNGHNTDSEVVRRGLS